MNKLTNIREYWVKLKKEFPEPMNFKTIKELDFNVLKDKVTKNDISYIQEFIYETYVKSTVYILKNAMSKKTKDLVFKILDESFNSEPSFHKMLDGCPKSHRIIDEKVAKKYSVYSIKHSFYLYHWNVQDDDQKKLFEEIYDHWRIIKYLGGNEPNAYEKNIPSDGVVDRIQIVHYPSGAGELRSHKDPIKNQNIITGVMLTKKGDAFQEGGNYFVDEKGKEFNIENQLDIGDSATFYGTLVHGVKKIDPKTKLDWQSKKGRWFLSMFCNDSDAIQKRVTAVDLSNTIKN